MGEAGVAGSLGWDRSWGWGCGVAPSYGDSGGGWAGSGKQWACSEGRLFRPCPFAVKLDTPTPGGAWGRWRSLL